MSDVWEAVSNLLSERPELEEDLEAILRIDDDKETWQFEDIPVDSGTFGEIVSYGIVEKANGSYRLAEPEAVREIIKESKPADSQPEVLATEKWIPPDIEFPTVSRKFVIEAVFVFGLVVFFRLLPVRSVFGPDNIVLSSNDPYFYRFWVEQVGARTNGPLDFSVLGTFPGAIADGEPLLVALLWFGSELLGGGKQVTGAVLAWYPVIAGLISAIIVYFLAYWIVEDYRVGLASVGLLAVTPGHAFRTGLGFADHHAFDYVWLCLTALALVALVDREISEPRGWGWAAVLSVSIAGQTLAWEAGPLLLIPVGVTVFIGSLLAVRTASSPIMSTGLSLAGIGLATILIQLVHGTLGWHTDAVAILPVLLFFGLLGGVLLAEGAHRWHISLQRIVAIEIAAVIAAAVSGYLLVPSVPITLERGVMFLFGAEGVAETRTLFEGTLGGPLAPIFLFGFSFFLAIPYLAWANWYVYREKAKRWQILVVYTVYLLGLALLQMRFAGQLALFVSIFAGLGTVHLLAWVDLTSDPPPFAKNSKQSHETRKNKLSPGNTAMKSSGRREILSTGGLLLGVGGLGGLLTPLKHQQVSTDRRKYRTAIRIREYSEEHGLKYPQNYVLSAWGRNRMYNYFVNGRSRSYRYAQERYIPFLASEQPDEWYDQFAGRVGFIVTTNLENGISSSTTAYERLHQALGSRYMGSPGLEHYRAMYSSEDRSHKVFQLGPGARITGTAPTNSEFELTTTVELSGDEFTYERQLEADKYGVYDIRVPYPGEYTSRKSTFEISETDVSDGRTISRFEGEGIANWSFNEGGGDTAYDRAGGNHLTGVGNLWTDGAIESAIQFDAGSERIKTEVRSLGFERNESITVSFFLRGDFSTVDITNPRLVEFISKSGMYGFWARNNANDFGLRINDADGEGVRNFGIERTEFGRWTHVAAVLDRSEAELRLYQQGNLVNTTTASGLGGVGSVGTFQVGPQRGRIDSVGIDELHIYDRVLLKEEIEREAERG